MSTPTISPRSLQRKLALPLLATGLAVAALAVWGIHATARTHLLKRLSLRAELIAHTVNHAAENVSQASDLDRIVSALGAEKEVNLIVIVGGSPTRVLATTRHEWLGKMLAELPAKNVAENLAEAIRTRAEHRHLHRDSGDYDFTSPLLLSRTDVASRALSQGCSDGAFGSPRNDRRN